MEPGPCPPRRFPWRPGASPLYLSSHRLTGQPQGGAGRGGLAAHSREGPGQVRSLPPHHPASASPAHKSRLPNEVPRSLKELQGPLL